MHALEKDNEKKKIIFSKLHASRRRKKSKHDQIIIISTSAKYRICVVGIFRQEQMKIVNEKG